MPDSSVLASLRNYTAIILDLTVTFENATSGFLLLLQPGPSVFEA